MYSSAIAPSCHLATVTMRGCRGSRIPRPTQPSPINGASRCERHRVGEAHRVAQIDKSPLLHGLYTRAENVAESLAKGARVIVTAAWSSAASRGRDGAERSVVELVARRLGRASVGRRVRSSGTNGATARVRPILARLSARVADAVTSSARTRGDRPWIAQSEARTSRTSTVRTVTPSGAPGPGD